MPLEGKVALVLDALPAIGGAEKVLMDVLQLYPDAPIFTLLYNRRAFRGTALAERKIIPSFIDRLPGRYAQYRKYLPLMPRAIEKFDLSPYDIILSFSYAVAHGVRVRSGQRHFSYTYTPLRYAWRGIGLDGSEKPQQKFLNLMLAPFRKWDRTVLARVDRLASVSQEIAEQVRCAYQRESAVIYPPVEVERFLPYPHRDDYFITVCRLVAHKRIDLMVQAFNQLGMPLLIVGDGPQRARLARKAKENIRFLGFRSDGEIAGLLSRARGYICAGIEDFGIAVVEAQAAGCPVIAYQAGGVLETVQEGSTGLFFPEPTAESLIEAVERFKKCLRNFCPEQIAASVQRFSKKRFLREYADFCKIS